MEQLLKLPIGLGETGRGEGDASQEPPPEIKLPSRVSGSNASFTMHGVRTANNGDDAAATEAAIKTDGSAADNNGDGAGDICGLCSVQFAKYTCPKCGVRYCNLACYKGDAHGDCAETFYKDEFMDGLKSKKLDKGERRKMEEMLRSFEAQALEEEEERDELDADQGDDSASSSSSRNKRGGAYAPLEERLVGIDLDDPAQGEDIWNCLTPQEQATFTAANKAGTLGAMLDPWIPWWRKVGSATSKGIPSDGIVELDQPQQPQKQQQPPDLSSVEAALLAEGIAIPAEVPALVRNPAAGLEVNLVDIAFSYAYTCRLYHGDLFEGGATAIEAAQVLLSLSFIMDGGTTCHASPSEAVQLVIARIRAVPGLDTGHAAISEALADVAVLLSTHHLITGVLAHVHQIVLRGQQTLRKKSSSGTKKKGSGGHTQKDSPEKERKGKGTKKVVLRVSNLQQSLPVAVKPSRTRTAMKQAERKAWFYVCWWQHLKVDPGVTKGLAALATAVGAEKVLLDQESASIAQGAASFENSWGGQRPNSSKLIEEI